MCLSHLCLAPLGLPGRTWADRYTHCLPAQAAWLQEFAHKCKDIARVFRCACVPCHIGAGGMSKCTHAGAHAHAHMCVCMCVCMCVHLCVCAQQLDNTGTTLNINHCSSTVAGNTKPDSAAAAQPRLLCPVRAVSAAVPATASWASTCGCWRYLTSRVRLRRSPTSNMWATCTGMNPAAGEAGRGGVPVSARAPHPVCVCVCAAVTGQPVNFHTQSHDIRHRLGTG